MGRVLWVLLAFSSAQVLPSENAVADAHRQGETGGGFSRGREDARAGTDWAPIPTTYDVQPGSPLDFSFLLDAPAGKHGPIVVRDGHFVFAKEPVRRIRFYGNHAGLEGMAKADCEPLAARFARMGYNAVRLHTYDQDLQGKNGLSTELDPGQEEVLDYLIYQMIQHGIYITLDLYVARTIFPNEVPGFSAPMQHAYKFLVHLDEGARSNWERFAAALLCHTNRYTGRPLAEEPALYGISLVNEDTPYEQLPRFPEAMREYQKAFARWKTGRNASAGPEGPLFREFVTDVYVRSYRRMMATLRHWGVSAPLTGVNFMEQQALALVRQELDYVDEHYYFDHPIPTGPGPMDPLRFHGRANERLAADCPRYAFPARIFGKPFTLSEWNQPYPNPARASSGPLVSAYAQLQDWDGVLRFKFHPNPYPRAPGEPVPRSYLGEVFAIADDPIAVLSDRLGALLFHRREFAMAPSALPYLVTSNASFGTRTPRGFFPEAYTYAGLFARVGGIVAERLPDAWPVGVCDPAQDPGARGAGLLWQGDRRLFALVEARGFFKGQTADFQRGLWTSETREITLDAAQGRLSLSAARTQVFALDGPGFLEDRELRVDHDGGYAVVAVAALSEGKRLSDSSRLLVFFLTDARASGLESARPITNYATHGKSPMRVRIAHARLSMPAGAFQVARLRSLGLDGSQRNERDVPAQAGRLHFDLSTDPRDGGGLAFEIIRR